MPCTHFYGANSIKKCDFFITFLRKALHGRKIYEYAKKCRSTKRKNALNNIGVSTKSAYMRGTEKYTLTCR